MLHRTKTTRNAVRLCLSSVLVMGLSASSALAQDWVPMGGGGTWYLGSKYSDIWAALAPMAPAISISPDILEQATHLPVMVVMGDADQAVDVEVTRQWVAKMEALGMSHEYIEVPGGSHSSAGRENIGKVFAFLDKHRKP